MFTLAPTLLWLFSFFGTGETVLGQQSSPDKEQEQERVGDSQGGVVNSAVHTAVFLLQRLTPLTNDRASRAAPAKTNSPPPAAAAHLLQL